jgi:hypothetical protein
LLRFRGDSPQIREKGKKRLNIFVLYGLKIQFADLSVFWPKFGSDEDWVCQALVIYVNGRRPPPRRRKIASFAGYRDRPICSLLKKKKRAQ